MRAIQWGLLLAAMLNPGCSCSNDVTGGDDMPAGGGDLAGADLTGGGGDSKMVACIPDLKSIALTPANGMVTLDGMAAADIAFTATGTFGDGHMTALDPKALVWSASRNDNTPPGTMTDNVLHPNPKSGGTVTVTAKDGCNVTGTTTVIFFLSTTIGMPKDPNAWMGMPMVGGMNAPTIVYPSDQTRFPRNIYRTLFQWRTGGGTEFRLTFEGPNGKVVVYTDGANPSCANKNPAAGCWEADETAWAFIAGSNAGATVKWTLDSLFNGKVYEGTPITIGFSRRDVLGAVFYWSTTSAGVRRANISAAQPEDYIVGIPPTTYTNPADQVQCIACHVVSRDGKYMAAPVQAKSGQSLWILEVTAHAPPNPLVKKVANTGGHGFATISPDDNSVVAAWGGKMWRVDRATGAYKEDLPVGMLGGTQPDWSPDNSNVVYAVGKGDAPGGASLAQIPWMNPGWGAIKMLAPASGASNLFPQYSPDGKWVAYSRGKGGHGDLTAQLWVIPASGGNPVEMINANRWVSNKLGTGQTENSQPTWAPPGDLDWVAFNSQREYGVVSPQGTQQIWVAAVDTTKAQGGMDPSYPAFRLQFQGLAENNHRAYWTLDIRDPPPDGGVPPPADLGCPKVILTGQPCDPLAPCCEQGTFCDTQDNGMTYTCIPPG
jgi:WD40-like Beta Propeller Repeat